MKLHCKTLLLAVFALGVVSIVVYRNTEAGKIAYHRKGIEASSGSIKWSGYVPQTFQDYLSEGGRVWLWNKVTHVRNPETQSELVDRQLKAINEHHIALMDLGYLKEKRMVLNYRWGTNQVEALRFHRMVYLNFKNYVDSWLNFRIDFRINMPRNKQITEVFVWTSDEDLPKWEQLVQEFNKWLEEREPEEFQSN